MAASGYVSGSGSRSDLKEVRMLIRAPSRTSDRRRSPTNSLPAATRFMRLAGRRRRCGGRRPRSHCGADSWRRPRDALSRGQTPLTGVKPKVVTTDEKLNTFEEITSYNNFYEFGTGKDDPQRVSRPIEDEPVEGEDRRALQQARGLPARGSDQAVRSSKSASIACAASKPGRW